jgi:hypothetical protein
MESYIKPNTHLILLNLSEQLLEDYEMMGYSKGSKKKDAWAKSHTSFETEDWDDVDANNDGTQSPIKNSVWND